MATAQSDIGIVKDKNQDSILIKHAMYCRKEILMTIICDGMGGLDKGELASAMIIREFEKWFSRELIFELENIDMNVIGGKWALMLKTLNIKIQEYGQKMGERLGTTFTGALFIDEQYVIVHVGDTRMYYIDSFLTQLTSDHTYVAREIRKGTLTLEQAKTDRNRNMLLQCVGASKTVEPQIICGKAKQGVYLLCSDGFRHKVTEDEICKAFNYRKLLSKRSMLKKSNYLIKLIKQRKEKDNISVILIKLSYGICSRLKYMNLWNYMYCIKRRIYLLSSVLVSLGIVLLVCGFLSL